MQMILIPATTIKQLTVSGNLNHHR